MERATDARDVEILMQEPSAVKAERTAQIAEQIVFLDGVSGTGKTMMGPILSSFDRMEVQRFDHIHEFICALRFLNRIEEDAAISLVRTYVDLACYNVMIGRESNFRWKDLSGVLNNPRGWRYVKRLFQPDGKAVMERIGQTRPILQIHSHQVLGISDTLFAALGKRLTVVELVRHPLYLLSHWYSCVDRIAVDPSMFTICLNHDGRTLPWFARGWENEYVNSNKMDRVIRLVHWLTQRAEDALGAMNDDRRQQVILIPFERFVVEPWPYLHQIETTLDTSATPSTRRSLRKQKVPRKLTIDGLDLEIYRRYNWQPPTKGSTEGTELQKRWDYASKEASKEGMKLLEKMSASYEQLYLKVPVS